MELEFSIEIMLDWSLWAEPGRKRVKVHDGTAFWCSLGAKVGRLGGASLRGSK